ncbi:MAG: DNA-3-methyladenine glycosylase 2 family protein [Candidatus Doudnabacteria bacterium]|nr:DNA-3-methyladenine glycosylase 2 family protein [Candidatus Doudnabacteria bacterium]
MLTPQAKRYLAKSDPVMADLVKRLDVSRYQIRDNTFRGLVESIISQQLSTKAARTIRKRFWEVLGTRLYKPQHILKTDIRKLRSCGLSGSKALFIKGLALAVSSKKLNLKQVHAMDNEQVIEELIKHKGVGKWTAEMFLIFSLGRLDVFSLGDWGLRSAMIKLYKLKKPSEKKLLTIAEKWKPYRSVASFYLWASLDNQ